jgi:hypothetical protein
MGKIATHTFNGRKYTIIVDQLDGMCSTYKNERELIILADLNTRSGLETAIHESLHALKWSACEDTVTVSAHDLARFLWRLNFRRIKDE